MAKINNILRRKRLQPIWRTIAAAGVVGASLFSPLTCDLRFKQSVIDGTQDFLFETFLNPETYVDLLIQANAGN